MTKSNDLQKPVTVTLFSDGAQYKDDAVVIVNGKTWLIARGVPVSVPKYVALALGNAMAQREEAKKICKTYTI